MNIGHLIKCKQCTKQQCIVSKESSMEHEQELDGTSVKGRLLTTKLSNI